MTIRAKETERECTLQKRCRSESSVIIVNVQMPRGLLVSHARERERDRFVGCHYTRKKNIHAQFAQNLRSQPFNRDRREHGKKEQCSHRNLQILLQHSIPT